MFSKSLAVGVLAAGCVAAAAGGAYLAVRQNAAAEMPPTASPASAPTTQAEPRPVSETEAVITPSSTAESDEVKVAQERARAPRTAANPKPTAERPTRTTVRPTRAPVSAAASAQKPKAPERLAEAAGVSPTQRESREPAAEASAVASPQPVREAISRPEIPSPPLPQFEQVRIPSSSVIGLQVETSLSSERAQVEDRVDARVTRDVLADGRVAIPAGARAVGTVTLVERGGKLKERARLGVRFHTLVLADGTELPISTEAIYREGDSPSGESSRKIGGAAIGGAILGAIIGGKKGAVVGGATGAAGGTAVVMSGDRNAATLPSGTIVTIRLAAPVEVEVEKR